jgi:hypothetical protein
VAELHSAIRQIGNLRYGCGALSAKRLGVRRLDAALDSGGAGRPAVLNNRQSHQDHQGFAFVLLVFLVLENSPRNAWNPRRMPFGDTAD